MTAKRRAYLALLTSAILWGLSPPLIKLSLNYVTPVTFLYYRFWIVTLLLIIPFIIRILKLRPNPKDLLKYLYLGILATPLNLYLLYLGIQKTSATDASILGILSPMLVVLGGVIFLKEKISRNEKIGLFITLLGAFITIAQPFFENKTSFTQNILGNLLVVLGCLTWAAFTLISKRQKNQHLDPFLLTASSFLTGYLLFIPLFSLQPPPLTPDLIAALPGILYMAIFGSIVAYFAYIYGLSKVEASEASIFTYLQPLFAIPVAMILLGDVLTLPLILGALLIGLGVFVSEHKS